MKIPVGSAYLRCNNLNTNNVNTIITNFYQIGPISHHVRVLIDLLLHIAEEPIFNVLRNKEQLGYDISCRLKELYGVLGYSIQVNSQENKFSVEHIDDRIESFRQELQSIIEKMPDEEFQQFKNSLIKSKLSQDLELKQEVSRNWAEITTSDYIFDWIEKEVEILKTLTKTELLEFYKKYSNEENRKLSIQIIGNPDACEENDENEEIDDICRKIEKFEFVDFATPKPEAHLITNIDEFKKKLKFYPDTRNLKN